MVIIAIGEYYQSAIVNIVCAYWKY